MAVVVAVCLSDQSLSDACALGASPRGIVAAHVAENPGSRTTRRWEFDTSESWDDDEIEDEYLERLRLWLPGEQERMALAHDPKKCARFLDKIMRKIKDVERASVSKKTYRALE